MAAAPTSDTELLTEHFGYPPVSLLDEIINSINFLAERALASVETGLLNAPPTQLGFGRPPSQTSTNADTKSKRKRKQQPDPPKPPEDAPAPELSPEEIEEQAHAEIAAGTHQLETLLCTSIDRNFDKFELYIMRNILCVRPEDRDWMRLGHYEGLNFDKLPSSVLRKTVKATIGGGGGGGGDDDEMDIDTHDAGDVDNPDVPTVDSVNRLRRRLQASQKLHTMLLAEKTRNDALLCELRAIVGRAATRGSKAPLPPAAAAAAAAAATATESQQQQQAGAKPPVPPLGFLHDKGDLTQADAATPLSTTTAFSLSQMQALRALSTSLSHILPDLKAATARGDGGEGGDEVGAAAAERKTWRKERVEYVESAARKHLENVRGLELGQNGEVRDGEWQGQGRRVGGREVGALEGVVEMLGEGGGGEGDEGEDEEMGGDGVE